MFKWFVFLGFACSTLHAQVTMNVADLAPRIGDHSEMTVDVFQTPLADLGIDFASGGPLEVDPTVAFDVAPLVTSSTTTDVLDPSSAPDAELYVGVDYVVKTSDVQTGEDVYFYFQEDDSQPVLLGISGSDLQPGFTDIMSAVVQDAGTQQFSDFYPLTFGKSFAPISVPIDVESLGLSMTGAYDMTGEVDAWGQVSVPAGTFDALRVFVHGESVLTLEAESEEPTVLTQTVDQWSWMAPRVGQCVVIQQITTRFSEIEEEVEPFTLTQVLRLSDFRSDITAVEAATWGALKAAMSR